MSLLDVGSGATSGLETLLARQREEEILKQRQQQLDETSRANKAEEALRGFTAGESLAARIAAQKATTDQKTFNEANQRQGEYTIGQDVPRPEASANVSAGLSPTLYQEPNQTTKSTVGVLPLMAPAASRMQDTGAQPQQGPIAQTTTTGKLAEPSAFLTYTGTGKERAAAEKEARAASEQKARDERADAAAEEARRRGERQDRRLDQIDLSISNRSGQKDDPSAIADAIIAGDQPPTLTGLRDKTAAVRAELAKKKFNLSAATSDWNATQRHLATLNGPQQTRLAQSISTAYDSLDVVQDLANQWDGGQFPPLNKAALTAAVNGALGPKAQQIATKLEAQITDVSSEIANAYMGGNSPTDRALLLASKNLQADWSKDQLKAAIDLARQNLQIRLNSIKNSGVAGIGGANPYAPQTPAPNSIPVGAKPTADDLIKKYGGS